LCHIENKIEQLLKIKIIIQTFKYLDTSYAESEKAKLAFERKLGSRYTKESSAFRLIVMINIFLIQFILWSTRNPHPSWTLESKFKFMRMPTLSP
jgi:hypothetical protein